MPIRKRATADPLTSSSPPDVSGENAEPEDTADDRTETSKPAAKGDDGTPTASAAQGAGDDQYQDPFGGGGGGGGGNSSGGGGGNSSGGGGGGNSSSTGGGATTTSNGTPAEAPPGTLANTGDDTLLHALFGLGLLMAGLGLRIKLREWTAESRD